MVIGSTGRAVSWKKDSIRKVYIITSIGGRCVCTPGLGLGWEDLSLSSSMVTWPPPKHDNLLSVDVVGIGAGKVQHMLNDGEAIQLYQHLHSIEYCWVKNELYLDLWR